ncbi:MAG: hypothetical protein OHK0039_48540 [Bacteroidia bacterium]
MSILRKIFAPVGSLIDRILCVVFAVVLAQAPVYMAQYIDVLSGAQMEAGNLYRDIERLASGYSLTVEEYLAQLAGNPDRMVSENAQMQQTAVLRYRRYTDALGDLRESSAWGRPFALMRHYDPAIHAALNFEPNVPLTTEGAAYAGLGIVLALLLIGLVKWIGSLIFRRTPSVYEEYENHLPKKRE